MRALDAPDILELTERGAGLGSARRALLALAAAYPEYPPEAIAATPLSARDRALLAVRARMLGAAMTAHDRCDACGEAIELTLIAEELGLAEAAEPFPSAPAGRMNLRVTAKIRISGMREGPYRFPPADCAVGAATLQA